MEQLLLIFCPVNANPTLPLPLEAASIARIIERPLGHDPMHLADKLRSELIRETPPHKFKGEKVVSDHPLRPRLWTSPLPEHLFASRLDVEAPSIWEDVIASSYRELMRYLSRAASVATSPGAQPDLAPER